MSPIPLPLPPLLTPSGNFDTFQIGGRSSAPLPVDDYDIVNKLYVDNKLSTGYVQAPASSVTNTIALFADSTGKLLKDSTLLVTSGNQISNISSVSLIGTGSVTISANPTSDTYSLVLPSAQGAANTFLRNDGSGTLNWATPGGGGNVTGPLSSTTNAIALYFNTTGTVIKNSSVLVSSTGDVTGVASLALKGTTNSVTISPAAATAAYPLTLPAAQSTTGISSSLVNDGTGTLSWASVGVLPPSVTVQPTTYALQLADQSKIFIYTTGGGTINYTNGSLTAGFYCYVKNGSSGDIDLQFNGVNVLGTTNTLHRSTGSNNSSICLLYFNGTNLILY